jgi:phage shock protein E
MKYLPWIILAAAVMIIVKQMLGGRASQGVVNEKMAAGATVLDVRTDREYAGGHYKGAIHIPVNELSDRMGELGKKDKPVVIYCLSGGRAGHAKKMLDAAGFKDVTNAGGLGRMPAP